LSGKKQLFRQSSKWVCPKLWQIWQPEPKRKDKLGQRRHLFWVIILLDASAFFGSLLTFLGVPLFFGTLFSFLLGKVFGGASFEAFQFLFGCFLVSLLLMVISLSWFWTSFQKEPILLIYLFILINFYSLFLIVLIFLSLSHIILSLEIVWYFFNILYLWTFVLILLFLTVFFCHYL